MIETLVTILHILTCIALILVIILQSGKGGGVSAAFGGGAGAALGQRSAGTVLGKFTAIAAGVFMVTSMVLAVFSTPSARDRTLNDVPTAEQKKTETPSKAEAPKKPKTTPVKVAPTKATPIKVTPKPAGDVPTTPVSPKPAPADPVPSPEDPK